MNPIILVITNTFKELSRDKTFYVLIFCGLIMIGFSMVLGQFTIHERLRLTVDFGLAGTHLACIGLTIFSGSSLVYKELEKKTVLFLLSKPLSRGYFLIGKSLGLLSILFIMIIGLALGLITLLFFIDWTWDHSLVVAMYGILLECMVLLGMTILLGVAIRPTLTVLVVISMFLIGHWMNGFQALVLKGENIFLQKLSDVLSKVFPNLERFNWRNYVVESEIVSPSELLNATGYAMSWYLVLLGLAYFAFRRKDFD